jgi:hypothetical protein
MERDVEAVAERVFGEDSVEDRHRCVNMGDLWPERNHMREAEQPEEDVAGELECQSYRPG